jgi:hypothetical protein
VDGLRGGIGDCGGGRADRSGLGCFLGDRSKLMSDEDEDGDGDDEG